jgi:ABC-type amino acid transport substrate-binding protein
MGTMTRRTVVTALVGLTALGLLGAASNRTAAAEGTIVFGTDPTYRPLAFYDENQNLVGFDIDLAEAMAERLGMELEIETMAFDGLIPALQTGRIDVEPEMAVRAARQEQVDFTTPFFSQTNTSVLRADDTEFNPQTANDLKGRHLGVTSGTAADLMVSEYPDVDITRYNTTPDSFRDLALGRVDVVVVDSLTAGYTVKHTFPDQLRVSDVALTDRIDIAAAVRKGNTDLLNRLNAAIEEMKRDGTLDQIVNKWFGDISY